MGEIITFVTILICIAGYVIKQLYLEFKESFQKKACTSCDHVEISAPLVAWCRLTNMDVTGHHSSKTLPAHCKTYLEEI